MADFRDAIFMLQDMGVADVLLPFLLVFSIVFAILQKTKILGSQPGAKRFNVIVALVMGLALIFPHVLGYYSPESDPVNIINAALPSVAVVIIAIIMVMLLLGAFGSDLEVSGTPLANFVLIFAFAAVAYIFGTAAGYFGGGRFPRWLWFLEDPNTRSLLVMILVFGGIIWFVTHEDKPKNPGAKGWGDALVPIYRGGGGGGSGGGGEHH
jgi:hypothetical protein